MRRLLSILRSYLPEFLSARLRAPQYRYSASDVPPPPPVLDSPVRLFIGPANSAAQGYRIARAVERLPGVKATNMQFRGEDSYGFPVDNLVPTRVYRFSKRWQRAQFKRISEHYTHVIFEVECPLFGELFGSSVIREAQALRNCGVKVAMLSYGSDLRLPSRHKLIDQWSPFNDTRWEGIPQLEAQVLDRHRLLATVDAPVFVTTPDMLLDWPQAKWLPIVVNPSEWETQHPPLTRERPLVVHVPTNAIIKGSDLIEPTMLRLDAQKLIEYHRAEGLPAASMPEIYRGADIMLEQFRIGTYSTAAIESLAAGRVVVAHIHDQVRDHIVAEYGVDVPVVEATVDALELVLQDILGDRERYRRIAAAGPDFVRKLHDGTATAQILRPFLLS